MAKPFDPYHVWLGIPPGHRPPTYYQLLGIAPDEQDREVIQAAGLRLSAYVRNFQIGKYADDANRVLTELAEAKACLLDAASRARYDATLAPPPANPPAASVAVTRPSTPARPVTPGRPRPAPVAAPPTIEMGELIVDDYSAPASRAMSLPAPRRRMARVAPQTSPLAWLLPLAIGLVALAVAAFVALRPKASDTPVTLDGQVVATAPARPAWQPAPTPPPSTPIRMDRPAAKSIVPPTIVETPPVTSPFSPSPSFAPQPPTTSSGSIGSSLPAGLGTNPPLADLGEVEKPAAPPTKLAPPVDRRPVPTGAALTAARRQVDSAFAKEFRTAKAEQRLDAVRGLYDQSQTAAKTALRYAYLEECRDRAINMSDAGLAFQALEEMGRLFDVDPAPLKVDALRVSLDKSRQPEQVYTVAMLALAARNRASTADPALAEQFDVLATAASRKLELSALSLASSGRSTLRRSRGVPGLPGLGLPRPGLATSIFAGNAFEQELSRRVDRHIDFQFASDSVDALPADRFSVRWTGWLTPPLSGKYLISATASGPVRVKIGDQTPIDSWQTVLRTGKHTKEMELSSMPYPIVVEYSQRALSGGIRLSWAVKDGSSEHTVPAEAFSHEPMIGE